jgi:hypothetical protein
MRGRSGQSAGGSSGSGLGGALAEPFCLLSLFLRFLGLQLLQFLLALAPLRLLSAPRLLVS